MTATVLALYLTARAYRWACPTGLGRALWGEAYRPRERHFVRG